MKKLGIFSDVHLGNYKDDPLWHETAIKMAQWAAAEYKSREITTIIIAGDLFHDRFEINTKTAAACCEFIKAFDGFEIYITTGNHDCFFKDSSDIHSLRVFDEWGSVVVVDSLRTLAVNGKTIALCPWGTKPSSIPKSDCAIGHWDVKGFYYTKGKMCEKGIDPLDLIRKAPMVITGHFHNHDKRIYEAPTGTVTYTGSPYQLNWGEYGQDKFIFVLDTETMELTPIKNTVSPIHIKLHTSAPYTPGPHLENQIVQLVVDTAIPEDEIQTRIAEIQLQKPRGFKVAYQYKENLSNDQFEESATTFDVRDDIRSFIQGLNIEERIRSRVETEAVALYNNLIHE